MRKIFELRELANIGFVLPTEGKSEAWATVLANARTSQRDIHHLEGLNVANAMIVCLSANGSIVIVESKRNSAGAYLPGMYAARYAMLEDASPAT
jgi:hypothetical protein